jgi:hypothetical protein
LLAGCQRLCLIPVRKLDTSFLEVELALLVLLLLVFVAADELNPFGETRTNEASFSLFELKIDAAEFGVTASDDEGGLFPDFV